MAQSVCTTISVPQQPSTIAPLYQFQPDIHTFLVGTGSVNEPNRIYQIEYEEGSNHLISDISYAHHDEIISLSTNPSHPDKLLTVSRDLITGESLGVLYKLPQITIDDDHNDVPLIKLAQFPNLSHTFPIPFHNSLQSYQHLAQTHQDSPQNNPEQHSTAPLNKDPQSFHAQLLLPDLSNITNPLNANRDTWGAYFALQTGVTAPQATPNVHLRGTIDQPTLQFPLQKLVWQPTNTSAFSSGGTSGGPGSGPGKAFDPTFAGDFSAVPPSTPTNASQSQTSQNSTAPNTTTTTTTTTPTNANSTSTVIVNHSNRNYVLAVYPHGVALLDISPNNEIAHLASTKIQFNSEIKNVIWNKHKVGEQFFVSTDKHIYGVDVQTMKESFIIPYPHGAANILSLDSNYIKQYTLLSAGDDGIVHVWDIRKPLSPLVSVRFFTQGISCCEYNIYHDNLVFAASYDATVGLFSLASVGSNPATSQQNHPFSSTGLSSGFPKNPFKAVGSSSLGAPSGNLGGGKPGNRAPSGQGFDLSLLFPRIEPPYTYQAPNKKTTARDNKQTELFGDHGFNEDDDQPQQQQTIQEAYDSDSYVPQNYAVAPANRTDTAAGLSIDTSDNPAMAIGDCLMSYHREHPTPVLGGCWSASSPWLYATLSIDGTFIINQVVPESDQYKLLL